MDCPLPTPRQQKIANEYKAALTAMERAAAGASEAFTALAVAWRSERDRAKVFEVYAKATIENIRQRALAGLDGERKP